MRCGFGVYWDGGMVGDATLPIIYILPYLNTHVCTSTRKRCD